MIRPSAIRVENLNDLSINVINKTCSVQKYWFFVQDNSYEVQYSH